MRSKNTFSVNQTGNSTKADILIHDFIADEFKEDVRSIEKLSGGINSEALRVRTDKNNEYFVKKYYRHKGDVRDRLATEFSALSFLWENGVRNIPEPLKASKRSGIAAYAFIHGSRIRPDKVTSADVDKAADFALRLQVLTASDKACAQPMASEACFSLKAYIDCLEARLENLNSNMKKDAASDSVRAYLADEFMPAFKVIKDAVMRKSEKLGIDINEELQKRCRTLSASDFGFNNAIKAADGQLFFVDFEYYGWDDPVKMIADFYLQPAVPVPLNYRKRFFDKVRKSYNEGSTLERRLSMIYPVLGLKWCLIMLNVFHCSRSYGDGKMACIEQLSKASKKLKEIKNEIRTGAFPYGIEEA